MSAEVERTDRHAHWDGIYRAKDEAQLSWHQDDPRKRMSFELITEFTRPGVGSRIMDIGGGSSTLAGALADAGLGEVTVLDISDAAIERARQRIGATAAKIHWVAGDVTNVTLPRAEFDLWHDRAVFHFLTDAADRKRYIELATASIKPGGHAIIATFALDGPEKCSGLPVQRYDASGIETEFGANFALVKTARETHMTPWGKPQAFAYAVLRRT